MNLVEELKQRYQASELDFTGWDLQHQNLCYLHLDTAHLSQANLAYANLASASLKGVDLSGAILTFANLTAANLSHANLLDADLEGATLTNTNLNQAKYSCKTIFPQGFNPNESGAILLTPSAGTLSTEELELAPPDRKPQESSNCSREHTAKPVVFTDNKIHQKKKVRSENGDQNSSPPTQSAPFQAVQARDHAPNKQNTSKNIRKVSWIPLVLLPILVGGIGIPLLNNQRQKTAILRTYERYFQQGNYELCAKKIEHDMTDLGDRNYSESTIKQLKSLKHQCLDKHYGLIFHDGTQLLKQQNYRAAIETLAKVPPTYSQHKQALEQIHHANNELCVNIQQQAYVAEDNEEFYDLLDQGYEIANLTNLPGPCNTIMNELRFAWEENIPELEEAKRATAKQNCEAIQAYAESMGRSIFRRWNQVGVALQKDSRNCYSTQRQRANVSSVGRSFPKGTCGDSFPTDSRAYPIDFYPVYATYNTAKLAYINTHYCRDAYRMTRENGQVSIQIASFSSRTRARTFANQLARGVEGVEIGRPTTHFK